MFIATTALKELWDLGDEVLLLGPWCVRYEDPGWLSGIRHRRLPNVWDDRARLEKAALYCEEIQEDLLALLSDYLSRVHGERLSPRYWRVLIGAWLLYYCHQLYDRFQQVSEALKAFPDARSVLLRREDYHVPRTTGEFLSFYHTDHYNLQLYSEIFRFFGKQFLEKSRSYPASQTSSVRLSLKLLAASAAAAAARAKIAGRGADLVTDGLYPAGQSQLWRWTAGARGRSLPWVGAPLKTAPAVMDQRRLGLASLAGKDEFRRLVIATLPYALPAVALEGLPRPKRRGPAPKAVLASTGWFYDDAFKAAAADWAERGAKLYGLQHGGQYGTAKYSLAEAFERRLADRYFTWGWSASEKDPKLADLPVPRLSEAAAKPRKPGAGDVVVMTVENVRNTHHLFPHPLGWQWLDYFDWLERFIAAADPWRVSLRLYPHDYGWNRRGRLKEKFPGLRLDDSRLPLLKRAESASLVVTDYPGTPFCELLALDVPSVHFWDERLWEARASAEPFFAALRRAGVVQPDPEAAARQVAAVRADPRAWWDRDDVKFARRSFVERYARVDARWPARWRAELFKV